VKTKCKAIFAVAILRNSSDHFLSLRGIQTLVSCPIVLSKYSSTAHYLKQFCQCLNFLFFHHTCYFGRWLFVTYL